ncbi:molybdate ABC transporter substrate-binding protein [Pseudooceanicola sp. CBS1P-1]|uniref:Molybdate-binding protein ModA n=1 Tax=Pseudooceanicola albus TaxID=2692189 RepID=A0A6L7G9B4_9RHOB|nr:MULTISPECIES: molybdate ABC transporter substrate-binding protein [Pseudooceanicola]MBT9386526.1 molybdate ABC transporter substrate-binding protein [Pseudooceanicola endophyticus]MXN20559.1 molybdate ABC transporter substrate-binding protein [Pseudooceanicola albus]
MTFFKMTCGAGLALALMAGTAQAGDLTVFAAASLKNAMDEIATKYHDETGNTLHVSLAGSSALARQIQQGAPADVFISANEGWMDKLEEGGEIDSETRIDLLANEIVLVSAKADAKPVDIAEGFDLKGLLGPDGHLAMALVDAVPAGIYGKASLESLGVWDQVKGQVAQADNVRAALALVSSGEAPYGIVYATDAAADKGVQVLGTFPEESHPPIIYPAATVASSKNPLDDEFLAWLQGDAATDAFTRQGFTVLGD